MQSRISGFLQMGLLGELLILAFQNKYHGGIPHHDELVKVGFPINFIQLF